MDSRDAQKDSSETIAVIDKQSTITEQDEEDSVDLTTMPCILSETDIEMNDTRSTPTIDNAALVQDSRQQKYARPKRFSLAISTSKSPLEV